MSDLIAALTILLKYGDKRRPTHCEHDVMIVDIQPDLVSLEDKAKLNELGFEHGLDDGGELCFFSFRFGKC